MKIYNCIGVVCVRLSIHNTTNPTEIEESKCFFLYLLYYWWKLWNNSVVFCDRYLCVAWATNEQHRIIKFYVYLFKLGTSFDLCYNTTPLSLSHFFTASVVFYAQCFSCFLPYSFYFLPNTIQTTQCTIIYWNSPANQFPGSNLLFHSINLTIKCPPFLFNKATTTKPQYVHKIEINKKRHKCKSTNAYSFP